VLHAVTGVSLALAGYCLVVIWTGDQRLDLIIAAIALSLAAAACGYALVAEVLPLAAARPRRPGPLVAGAGIFGVHVVVISDEEPEEYDPRAVTIELARYAGGDVDLPPLVGRHFIYASERARYHQAGGSPARATVRAVAAALEDRLRSEDLSPEVSVSAAFCSEGPTLAVEVSRIVALGGRRILVAPLGVAWSHAFTEAVESVPNGALIASGAVIETTEPLWASSHLSAMLARRVLAAVGDDRSQVGVILVSEGDSREHAASDGAYRDQLTFFIQRVRAELIESGIPADMIRRAALWLGEPDVGDAARHLAAVGARAMVLVPVASPSESIVTLIDVPYLAERAQADTGAVVTVVKPWGEDPAVIEALRDCVVTALGATGASEV
jgi:protoheme ferro-lyase